MQTRRALQSRRKFLMSATAAAMVATEARSEDSHWPDRPVRIVVPYPAGGSTDVLTRILAERLKDMNVAVQAEAPRAVVKRGEILRLEKVSRHFGTLKAVDDVSFEMGAGELRAVIGPNGAGKTTFFNLISGLLGPTTGQVWFAGNNITGQSIVGRVAQGIVRTFQITEILPDLSAFENIRIGVETSLGVNSNPWAGRATRTAVNDRVNELVEIVGLEGKEGRVVGELAHASHWSALLSGLRGSLFRRFFQEGEQVGALLGILDAGKRHLISGHEMLRVLSPFIECLVVPLNVCGFKGGRIAAETRHASCFSVPHFR